MRKTLAVVTLTAALTGVPATAALADDVTVAAPPAASTTSEDADNDDSDKTGLWGLLGLLGLAGLAKRKGDHDVDVQARR